MDFRHFQKGGGATQRCCRKLCKTQFCSVKLFSSDICRLLYNRISLILFFFGRWFVLGFWFMNQRKEDVNSKEVKKISVENFHLQSRSKTRNSRWLMLGCNQLLRLNYLVFASYLPFDSVWHPLGNDSFCSIFWIVYSCLVYIQAAGSRFQ